MRLRTTIVTFSPEGVTTTDGAAGHARELTATRLRYGREARWADAFDSEEAERAAWERSRDRMLAHYRHGRRPAAWWRYDAPAGLRFDHDCEQSTLYEAGLLGEEERAELETFWREEFERAQQDDFWACLGPGKILHGEEARQSHYCWMDIPCKLLEQWTKEHRRRGKTVHELEAAATAPTA